MADQCDCIHAKADDCAVRGAWLHHYAENAQGLWCPCMCHGKARHLTCEEQQLFHKALRKSVNHKPEQNKSPVPLPIPGDKT